MARAERTRSGTRALPSPVGGSGRCCGEGCGGRRPTGTTGGSKGASLFSTLEPGRHQPSSRGKGMLRSKVRIARCTTAGKSVGSGNSQFGNDLQAVAETGAGSERAPKHAIFGAQPATRDGLLTRTLGICHFDALSGIATGQQAVVRQGNAREPFSSNGRLVAVSVRRSIAVTHSDGAHDTGTTARDRFALGNTKPSGVE